MGRFYEVHSQITVAASTQVDVIEIANSANAILVVHAVDVAQQDLSPVDGGDVQAILSFVRASASGSGGSAGSALRLDLGDAAAGFTVEVGNTTLATTSEVPRATGFNVLAGFSYLPTPETRMVISPSDLFVLRLLNQHASESITFDTNLTLEEIGG